MFSNATQDKENQSSELTYEIYKFLIYVLLIK